MINDHTKGFVIRTILFNDRLNAYKEYLRYAAEQGYQVISLEDFYQLPNRRERKHFILRHDVDWLGNSTRRMFEAERTLEVTSTYYFRFSTIDLQLIAEMRETGFQVGFHFETISDYIRESGITDKRQIDMVLMRARFAEDVRRFEDIVGFKITSCCSHGHPLNSKLGISNNAITEGMDLLPFGLSFEAYDAEMYDKDVDCHIMDGSVLKNYGFQYDDNPYKAIQSAYQNIVCLSHPHNWFMNPLTRMRFTKALLFGKATFESNRTFQRVAE